MDVGREAPLEDFTQGELVKMVTQGWVGRVIAAITETIAASFESDQILRPVRTRDEIQRRFRICVEGFVLMRRELGWAVPRILDDLPVYLRHRLDGTPWDPDDERGAWLTKTVEEPLEADPSGEDYAGPLRNPGKGIEIGDRGSEG